ncbi:hypothetical protein P5673_003814 [Acropora cervicornis]|uniref:Uncharacterized protein n=1 Tax=Acropora cervicornis TaxID=6130 RepID=A0AAD9R178_ACRCE|nr:hypothetical protein P5673_003814 [Acropora cervicornis]
MDSMTFLNKLMSCSKCKQKLWFYKLSTLDVIRYLLLWNRTQTIFAFLRIPGADFLETLIEQELLRPLAATDTIKAIWRNKGSECNFKTGHRKFASSLEWNFMNKHFSGSKLDFFNLVRYRKKKSTISEIGTRMQLGVDSKGSLMMEVDTYALQQLLYLSFVYRQDKAQPKIGCTFASFNPTSSLSFPHVLSQVPNKHKFSLVLFMCKANLSGTDGLWPTSILDPKQTFTALQTSHTCIRRHSATRWIKVKRGLLLDEVLIQSLKRSPNEIDSLNNFQLVPKQKESVDFQRNNLISFRSKQICLSANEGLPCLPTQRRWTVATVSDQREKRIGGHAKNHEVQLLAESHAEAHFVKWCTPVGRQFSF